MCEIETSWLEELATLRLAKFASEARLRFTIQFKICPDTSRLANPGSFNSPVSCKTCAMSCKFLNKILVPITCTCLLPIPWQLGTGKPQNTNTKKTRVEQKWSLTHAKSSSPRAENVLQHRLIKWSLVSVFRQAKPIGVFTVVRSDLPWSQTSHHVSRLGKRHLWKRNGTGSPERDSFFQRALKRHLKYPNRKHLGLKNWQHCDCKIRFRSAVTISTAFKSLSRHSPLANSGS